MSETKHQSTLLVGLPYMALLLVGFGLLGGVLVEAGIGCYLGLTDPQRLAFHVTFLSSKSVARLIEPQPQQIAPTATNVMVALPPPETFIAHGIAEAPVWANGKAFKSGTAAAWEVVSAAWRLWVMAAGAIVGIRALTR